MPRSATQLGREVGGGVADDGGLRRSSSRRDSAIALEQPPSATLCEVTETPTARDHPHRQGRREDRRAARRPGRGRRARRCASPSAAAVAPASSTRSPSTSAKDDDHVFEVDGVAVVVDKVSMQFVFGSEVDYVEGLQGAGLPGQQPERRRGLRLRLLFPGERGRGRDRRRLAPPAIRSAAAATAPAAPALRLRRPPAARRRAPRPARRTRTSPRRCRRRRPARR